MDGSAKKLLYDILAALEEMESFFGNVPRCDAALRDNPCLRRAVERNMERVGEAVRRITKEHTDVVITDARQIAAMRDFILHRYDSVSVAMLWSMLTGYLPRLRKEVTALLQA